MLVCKFGGTSVRDSEAQHRLAAIVRDRLPQAPLVVVSALAGVSDALLRILDLAAKGDEAGSRACLAEIERRHLEMAAGAACREEVEAILATLESHRRGMVLLEDAPAWARARFVASGELLSSRLTVASLEAAGIEARWFDAREVVRTEGSDPEKDPPLPEAIARRVQERLAPLLRPGAAVVTQGFIGAEAGGRTTLLGRGGSDYSASLLGAALGAARIEIWTDVDGVLTANPRLVPEARRVRVLSFDEASELAYFGAKVLHPSTLLPAMEASIPVWVGNAMRPAGDGTTIVAAGAEAADDRVAVKAIADKRGIVLVHVASTRMLMAHGFLARIFAAFERHRTVVDLVATSEVSVSLTVDDDRRLGSIVAELESFARVRVERGMAVICLVGAGIARRASAAAEVFRAIGGAELRLVSQGASAINLSLVVSDEDLEPVVRRLHETFFSGSLPAEIFGEAFRDAAVPRPVPHGETIEPARLRDAAERHGTPLYVYDLDLVRRRAERVRRALAPLSPRLFYACKANAHPAILAALVAEGWGIEAASPGEAARALEAGAPAGSIVLSSNNAPTEGLRQSLRRGCVLTLGALSDLSRLGPEASGAEILLRVNPRVGEGHHRHVVTGGTHSKFGILPDDLPAALGAAAKAGLEVIGLHAHIGSGIVDPEPLAASLDRLLELVPSCPDVRVVDLGGGFGIPYRDGERELDLDAYAAIVRERLDLFGRRTGRTIEPWFEPGRFVVAPAGALVARVTCRKESGGLVFVGLDTGMNHLLRPALYGAYHRIVNLTSPDAPVEWVEVVGNVCESSDVFASARPLPRAEEGDLLAILDAGAYGFSMASAYNLWPMPKELVLR